ncbi:MAG: hypothetical protein J6T10_26935 [Methanobrevibacter sp.]|nr:hypothetical protein [Methanobrevibacter sp.]
MGNVRLCDDICSPDCHDELCIRCIKEQYEYLIDLDDYDYVDDWFCYDSDRIEYYRELNEQLENIDDDLPF